MSYMVDCLPALHACVRVGVGQCYPKRPGIVWSGLL